MDRWEGMNTVRRLWIVGGLSLGLLALSSLAQSQTVTLTVYAASSLAEFLKPLVQSYEKAYPGVRIALTTGSSDLLVTQVLRGKSIDVLLTADDISMSRVISADLVGSSESNLFATNTLALVSLRPIASLEALRDPADFKRIAVPNPQISPAGRYARDALNFSSMWKDIQGRLVLAQDVKQALSYVLAGEVDAAVVYRSSLLGVKDARVQVFNLPGASGIRYFVAPFKKSFARQHALQFVQLVRSEPARQVLLQHQLLPIN
jgi:molybdate transport system substrate-binding protein